MPSTSFTARPGLREDVMEIVADAEEAEALLEELGHARGAEQEDAEDDVVLLARPRSACSWHRRARETMHVGNLYFS